MVIVLIEKMIMIIRELASQISQMITIMKMICKLALFLPGVTTRPLDH